MPTLPFARQPLPPRTFLLVCLAVSVMILAFAARPYARELREATAELARLQEDLEAKRAQGQSITETLRLYQAQESVRNDLQNAALSRSRELELITALETAADQSGVTAMWDVGNYTDLPDSEFALLSIQAQLSGSYASIVRFLALAERLPQYVVTEHITVTQSTLPSAPQQLQATVTFHSYWH